MMALIIESPERAEVISQTRDRHWTVALASGLVLTALAAGVYLWRWM